MDKKGTNSNLSLTELFEATLSELRAIKCTFAVAGGFAADLYRAQARGTSDIDFLFVAKGITEKVGRRLIQNLGLAVGEVKLHQLKRSPTMNKKSKEIYILAGRRGMHEPGIDLLLEHFPWFGKALERAQFQLIDFGFGPTPTITAEDVILAKLFANRPKDVDDIISIFESQHPLDLTYLAAEMERLKLFLPDAALITAPKALKVLSKRGRRQEKKPFP